MRDRCRANLADPRRETRANAFRCWSASSSFATQWSSDLRWVAESLLFGRGKAES